MADAPGSRVGHYRLVEPIGTGGFATVYRAVDERLDADVAVKVLAENHALDPDLRERFITEAQLLRRVANPSIIEIHDVGETERGQPFIVMTYADRGDLRRRVAELGTVAPTRRDIADVVEVLANALGAVHRNSMVHRDVKPDNLLIGSSGGGDHVGDLLRPDERLRLGDLGYAKDLGASSGLTVGGGTHGFNAPEQRVGLGSVDARADVYGASAVVFWLLTGTTPPETAGDVRRRLTTTVADGVMTDALVTGLAHDPNDRFATIDEWRRAIGVLADDSRSPDARRRASVSLPRARRLAAVGVVVGVVVGALAGVGVATVADRGSGPHVGITDDGLTRVQAERGDLRLAVFGSPEAVTGETATFQAAAQGATTLTWIGPDGSPVEGVSPIDFVLGERGTTVVTLIGRDGDGTTLSVDFAVEVAG